MLHLPSISQADTPKGLFSFFQSTLHLPSISQADTAYIL